MTEVTCAECRHKAVIGAPSDVWKCPCATGAGPDPDCACEATNHDPGAEDNAPGPAAEEAP